MMVDHYQLLYCSFLGTFQLHPFTKCDLERPVDRPLGFMFLPAPSAGTSAAAQGARNRGLNKKQLLQDKTTIKATFKPEIGGRILQVLYILL